MSQTYSPPGPQTRRTRNLLLAIWAILSLAAVALVLGSALNAPAEEEWEFVSVLTGNERLGPWMWAQSTNHRQPLARLLYYAEFRLTHDFRAGMLLQVAMLSTLSLGLMRMSAGLRGRPDWADLFFPISLLHLGHWANFLLGYQLRYVLFLVFAVGLVVVALRAQRETAFRAGVLGGVLLLLAALTGGPGLALVPPVVAWLGYLAVVVARTEGRGKAGVVVVIALASALCFAIDLVSSEKLGLPSGVTVLMVVGEAFAMALGGGVHPIWPVVAGGVAILSAAAIVQLVRRGRDPAVRPAAIGLIAVVAGIIGVAAAIEINRTDLEMNATFWSRSSFLTWPLLGAVYLILVKAGWKWGPIGLCIAAALAFPANTGSGLTHSLGLIAAESAMEGDLRTGMFDRELIDKHFPNSCNAGYQAQALAAIPKLRDARIGLFAPEGQDTSALWWVAIEVLVAALAGRWLWNVGRAVQAERARELFRLQHERYEDQLIAAASTTGLPRGLRWVSCAISGDALLVRDTVSGGIVALVPVVIHFFLFEGSDMEEIPAAREPRPATAVFTFARGTWTTSGRVVFNHTPEQTIAKFAPRFRVIQHGRH